MIFSSSSFDETDFDVGLDAALLEDVDGGGGKLIGDENAGGGHDVCPSSFPRKRENQPEFG